MSFIVVRHNIEVAHRLFELEGNKCQNIHGHSMWIEMKLYGHPNQHGILEGLDFGTVKKAFREFLDTNYDHHLLLNSKDPWAGKLASPYEEKWIDAGDTKDIKSTVYSMSDLKYLPGLKTTPGDPSTENIAKWVATWAVMNFQLKVDVHVQETHVNGAGYSEIPNGK